MPLEPPSSPSNHRDSGIDSGIDSGLDSGIDSDIDISELEPTAATSPPVQYQYGRAQYGRALLGLGVFVLLSSAILLITQHIKPANSMAGMDGHDMSGMSHDDMMRVDGAFNPVPVTVEVVQPGNFEAGVSYTGSIMPYQEAVVYPRVTGQLTNYSVYPGDRVEAQQVLAELIANERSTELAEAQAETETMTTSLQVSQVEIDEQVQEITRLQTELDYLKLQQSRFATLTAEGATSQNELDVVATEVAAKAAAVRGSKAKLTRLQAQVTREQARVNQAQAQVNTAAVMQGYTTLQAPISGIVQSRMVDPGVVVQPGMGVLKIGDYSRVRLQANVAQQDAANIQVGTPIRAKVPGAIETSLEGSVTSIFPQTNNDTRTVVVEAIIDNPQERLLSGQYLEMTLLTGRQRNALSVPQSAVVTHRGESAVWVMVGSTAERRTVETGMVSGDRMAITRGLSPGDQVITSGHSRLAPDVQVVVVDDAGAPVPVLGESRQGNVDVAIVEPDSGQNFQSGGADLVLEVRDLDTQKPLPVEDVTVDVTMPMPNMAPMTTMVQLTPAGQPGRFQVKTHFGMVGEWQIKVAVNDPDYKGQALITVSVE